MMTTRTRTPVKPVIRAMEPLLTVAEVGEALRITPKAVRALIYQGKLQAFYLAGRRVRVKMADLNAFLQTQMKRA